MKVKAEEEVDDQIRYTEVDPVDIYLDYEAVKSTARNLASGLIRAKRLSDIKKARKPKIKKKSKNPKKSK